MEMKRKKISVTSLILPVIMLVVAVVLPMIYSTNYYIQLFSQTLINLVAVLGLNVVMGLAGQTNLGTIALVASTQAGKRGEDDMVARMARVELMGL